MDVSASLSCPNMHTSGSKHWPVSSPAFSAPDLRVFIVFVVSFDTGGSDSEREPQFPQLADHRSQSGMF